MAVRSSCAPAWRMNGVEEASPSLAAGETRVLEAGGTPPRREATSRAEEE